jgi:hypothetical protein
MIEGGISIEPIYRLIDEVVVEIVIVVTDVERGISDQVLGINGQPKMQFHKNDTRNEQGFFHVHY